jgi:hypothetical protein
MLEEIQVVAENSSSSFTLKLHRGEGMTLLSMNWKNGEPPLNFVGFAIEYREPNGLKFWPLKNLINFPNPDGSVSRERTSSLISPFQSFRWVHFPLNADLIGLFTYRVTPVFMNDAREISYGISQEADVALARETYPEELNVAFTRGFVTSQAFVKKFVTDTDGMQTLIPYPAELGLNFTPTHPRAEEAYKWMGFEARAEILNLLDKAIADKTAVVRVIGYDLNDPAIVTRLEQLESRLRIIIDDSKEHKDGHSAESQSEARLITSAGASQVKRHHMSRLQHNKVIIVSGDSKKTVICGSTNFTWRGQFVQSNNAVVLQGANAIEPFIEAFENYWIYDSVRNFGPTNSTGWHDLRLDSVDVSVTFSPHTKGKGVLDLIAEDINNAESSVFYSLAFLQLTGGAVTEAINNITKRDGVFVYGISDQKTGGLDVHLPNGKVAPVYAKNLSGNLPEPFKSEPSGRNGGAGTCMHHKFIVIDFDKPTARVYTGSYNFSNPADNQNGENLLLIKDRRIAVSYMIQALSLFDHYHFRVKQSEADASKEPVQLKLPPNQGEKPWWNKYYTNERKVLERTLFA